MRRPLWMRVVTAMWAVWLGVALSQPMALHPCATQSSAQMANMPGMGGASGADLAHHGTPSHDAGKCCMCLRDCCCAPPVLAPSHSTADVPTARAAVHEAVVHACDTRGPAIAAPHSLPFANGPPASLSI